MHSTFINKTSFGFNSAKKSLLTEDVGTLEALLEADKIQKHFTKGDMQVLIQLGNTLPASEHKTIMLAYLQERLSEMEPVEVIKAEANSSIGMQYR
jgi:hypothetical protein